ncbi:MAG: type II toxin-antitoxin system VapC family toxin [Acidobacteriota bacterium]
MIVLDSSFLIAHHNSNDIHHEGARVLMEGVLAGIYGRALLLEYVFLEVATVLLLRRGLAVATSVALKLMEAREVDFRPCSQLFPQVMETFRNQTGERLSFVDAAVVTVARQHDPGYVATFDKDFRDIEGVSVLPR